MIRREYPFYGKVSSENIPMSDVGRMEQERIIKHFDKLIENTSNPTARRNYAGQKTLTLSRWSEQQKLHSAVEMAKQHLENGGQVVIVAETNKRQQFPQPVAGGERGEDAKGRPAWFVDGAITQLDKMLNEAGITDIAHINDPTSNNIRQEVDDFQNGRSRVALATPQSGGTGIDLDDVVGNKPRMMIALSKNMAGDAFEQLIGRVSRKNTKSESEVKFLNLHGSFADNRRNDILDSKIRTLKAIQGGEELDRAGGFQAPPAQSGQGGILHMDATGLLTAAKSLHELYRGAKAIGRFAKDAVSKFGEWIRPHAEALWNAAKKGVSAVHDYLKGAWQAAKDHSETGAAGDCRRHRRSRPDEGREGCAESQGR